MPRTSIARLTPNVPQQIALKSDGLATPSGEQVRFDLMDGRALLLDLDAAQRLTDLCVNLEEPFWICLKWTGSAEDAPYVDMWLDPAGERRRAREEAPEIERQLRESIRIANSQRPGRKGPAVVRAAAASPKPEPPSAAPLLDFEELLLLQTNAMTDAYARALKYAGEAHGNSVKPDDIRSFVVTAFIQLSPRGHGRRNAA